MRILLVVAALTTAHVQVGDAQDRTRLLNDLNWIELRGVVPDTVATVLLPAGTLEPHGVVNKGADNTVPVEMANRIERRHNSLIAQLIPYWVTTTLD